MSDTETHPLPSLRPAKRTPAHAWQLPAARERWKMDFYYPNIQNDMWRIFGLVFFNDREHFVSADGKGFREAAIRDFLGDKRHRHQRHRAPHPPSARQRRRQIAANP